jgi:hypothetical protein
VAEWAVWSNWRGDRAKLARIPRAMESSAPGTPVRVELTVLGDLEEYASVGAFVADAPSQSTRAFEVLAFHAGEGFEVVVRRSGGPTGVVLTAPSAAQLDRVMPAITRGSLQWRWAKALPGLGRATNYDPSRSTRDGGGASAALAARNTERDRLMRAWTAVVLFGLFAVGAALALAAGVADTGSFAVATVIAAVAAVVLALLRPVRNLVLPPVEVAERTPGRRVARGLTALAAPLAGALIKLVTG